MKTSIRYSIVIAVLAILFTAVPAFAQSTIDFESPPLGGADRQLNEPYVDSGSGVKFTAEFASWGDEAVGLVKNSATSACAEPSDSDQKLGTGRDDGSAGGSVGLSGFAIRAIFPAPLSPPVSVSAEFQTGVGVPIRIRLFDAAGVEVGSTTDTAGPAAGTCGFPGDPRARKTISAASAQQVAYAILDLDTSTTGRVFVIDDFKFTSGPSTAFPATAGNDVTRSLGSFRILVHPKFRPLMAGYPGYDGVSRLQSPTLFDPDTLIGRSAPHTDNSPADTAGTPVGTAGTLVADGDFTLLPGGFEGPPGTNEVHTEVRSLNMTSWRCSGVPGVAVRAGIDAPGRPLSLGEVESLAAGPGAGFPAESFFDVFAEIDMPPFAGFPGGTLYNSAPLLVANTNLLSFPPRVVYVHANTNAVPVRFLHDNPGVWSANELYGWLVLAGHAVGFDCGETELEETLVETPEQKPKPVEIDHFRFSRAQLTLLTPLGQEMTVELEGPATVHVAIDETDGATENSTRDGHDYVETEMVSLSLKGTGEFGPIEVRLDEKQRSVGQIIEHENSTPGILDLPPFAEKGTADSFFDIWPEIAIGPPDNQQILHVGEPIRVETVISHKPPRPGEGYQNPFTTQVPLLTANGEPTGFVILGEIHTPRPPIEIDRFSTTGAVVGLQLPTGNKVNVVMSGPATILVELDSLKDERSNGADGSNGLEEVDTEIYEMELSGNSALGPISLRAGRGHGLPSSLGQIEEKENRQGERLDLPGPDSPFCTPPLPTDCEDTKADSFFDVFFEVEVGSIGKLHNQEPLRLQSVITRKPPKRIYSHVNTEPIQLFTEKNQPSGVFLITADHNTDPVEIDHFELTRALVGVQLPDGSLVNAVLGGPATVHVDLASLADLRTGGDPGANGLEEINTELVEMELTGSTSLGPLVLRAGRRYGLPRSRGQIEEQDNVQPGRLDLPGPDAPLCTPPTPADCVGTHADSFFDVHFEIEVPGVGKLYNRSPLRLQAVIDEKPPKKRYRHVITDPIELFTADGRRTGVYLVTAEHNTGKVEVDELEATRALVGLKMADGSLVNVILNGPSTVEVELDSLQDSKSIGVPGSNGLEEVDTELISMELTGSTPLGAVKLRAGRVFGLPATVGQIEEKENKQNGRLDLPGPDAPLCTPPTPADCVGTQANSFFDVFFEVEVAGVGVLHNRRPLRLEAMITEKPPKARYSHVITEPIELFDRANRRTGIFLVTAEHNTGPVEIDVFERTVAAITLMTPNGTETVRLRGPSTVHVFIDDTTGAATDTDNDGREQVRAQMTQLDLKGYGSMGTVRVRLNPEKLSTGEIEEQKNNTEGVLDIPPFADSGRADSFFDVFFDIEVRRGDNVQVFHAAEPARMASVITHKPPAPGDLYRNPFTQPIELLDENGRPTGLKLVREIHIPNPPIFLRKISLVRAGIAIRTPQGIERIPLRGFLATHVFLGESGEAADLDDDKLDQALAEVTQLELRGTSSLGPVIVRLSKELPSTGEVEERVNKTPGILDVRPFASEGVVDSFFDIWIEVEIGDASADANAAQASAGNVYHTDTPLRLNSEVTNHASDAGQEFEGDISEPVELLDEDGKATGLSLVEEVSVGSQYIILLPMVEGAPTE